MAYDRLLAERVREYLAKFPQIEIEEKEMFSGLAFLVNGKMCVNVSGQNLMCRFDAMLTEKLSEKRGFIPMVMKGQVSQGYGYIEPVGFKGSTDFEFWIDLCLDFKDKAKSSKRSKKK
jgi:hypothetical protein